MIRETQAYFCSYENLGEVGVSINRNLISSTALGIE